MIDAAERPATNEPVPVLLQQGIAHYRQGNMAAAEDVFTRVMLTDPGHPDALHLLGLIAEQRGDLSMAEPLLERSIQMKPHSRVWLNLGVVKQHRGNLNGAITCYRQAIALEPQYADAWTNLLFAIDMHPHYTPAMLRAEREAFDEAVCARWYREMDNSFFLNERDPGRQLRVGYVGGDFRARHSASMSFGWIQDHDRDAVRVYLYSTYDGNDPTIEPFKAKADEWCEIGHLSPDELHDVIYDDHIDILVDLGGAAQGGRSLTFAQKPAPIQIGGWGYPHGLGMRAMDYMVGDPVATPPEHAHRYPEHILSLPCLMGYRPELDAPDVGTAPQERLGYRTYGYLGRAMKLNDETLAIWAEILRADPTGRLILKSPQYADRRMYERVVHGLCALGVDLDRIEVRGLTSRREHLLAHHDVDVALEPLIHGSGQTTMDACLMGVPTVCMPGETVSSRISASILTTIRAGGWITQCQDEYANAAVLGSVIGRQHIRDRLLSSVICDGPAYARATEAEFRRIWRRWCEEGR